MKGSLETSKLFLKRNSPTILTCLGAAGVVATSVMAVKATPKAILLLEEAEKEKKEKLTKLEKLQVIIPSYIPSILMSVSTIVCIFGANALNKRNQAALMSAYALLDHSYKEYKRKVRNLLGEEIDDKAQEEMRSNESKSDELEFPKGRQLFLDFNTLEYFEADFEDVLQKAEMEDGLECYIITTPVTGFYL